MGRPAQQLIFVSKTFIEARDTSLKRISDLYRPDSVGESPNNKKSSELPYIPI